MTLPNRIPKETGIAMPQVQGGKKLSGHPPRLALKASIAALSICSALLPSAARANSISPGSFEATLNIGEVINVAKEVFTTAGSALVDIAFLSDNTGSMGGVINNVRNSSAALLSSLNSTFPDARFGVARYLGDPSEFGEDFDSAYDVITPLTSDLGAVTDGFNDWFASGGGDGPEANFYALHQAVTDGASTSPGLGSAPGFFGGTGEALGWRPEATKVILWFGDVTSHQDTVTLDNVIDTLAGTKLVALNSTSAGFGLDGNFADGGQAGNQASTIVEELGSDNAVLFNNFASVPSDEIAGSITALVEDVTDTVDLSLIVGSGDTSGLNVSFSCTDPLGCEAVPRGESRTFNMAIEALGPVGTYDFTVVAPGVPGAVEVDNIEVVPGPLPILGVGAAMAYSRRLRKRVKNSTRSIQY